jgi:hypothetical protein
MAWTLEAVDLITARLLANAGAGTLLLLLCLRIPRIVGSRSTRSWARVPRHRGRLICRRGNGVRPAG